MSNHDQIADESSDTALDYQRLQDLNTAVQSSMLCQNCALCCDGTIFNYVEVSKQEARQLEGIGLGLHEDKKGKQIFNLSCPKLKDCKCTIYPNRPKTCVSFHCALTRSVMNETVTYTDAGAVVLEVKKSAAWLLQNAPDFVKSKPFYDHDSKPAKLLAMWHDDSAVRTNLRQILYEVRQEFSAYPAAQDFTETEKKYIFKAFEHLKLVDRHLTKTKLLLRYAELVNRIHIANDGEC